MGNFPITQKEFDGYCQTEIGAAAKLFDEQNPRVYHLFHKFAYQIRNAGHVRFSSKAIFERIRWETMVNTTGSKFKLQNNHTPYYARKFLLQNPHFGNFFTMKGRLENEG